MPHGLNCPQAFVPHGLELTSRTGLSSSHCGASPVMNSGSQSEHMMSRSHNSSHTRQGWGYMESQSTVDLTSLVLYPSGYIDKGNECWMKLPWVTCVSYVYEFWHKATVLSKNSSGYDTIQWYAEWVPGIHLVPRD
jgi:hypothetical protein